MSRTALTKGQVQRAGGTALKTKLAEHDSALDALEALTLGAGDFKQSVRAASTANLTLSGAQTIDGVACIAGDRVLAKDQTTSADKGIYVVASGAWARATDMDASSEATAGVQVFVSEGTVNGNSIWDLTTDDAITLGSTSLTFTKRPQLTELASTATGKGAALVGIEDSAAKITATTVEGALAEIAANGWATGAHLATLGITANKMAVATDADVLGSVPIVYNFAIADGVTANADIVVTNKCEVIRVDVQKRAGAGGASDTIQVKNSGTAITDAMSINVSDKVMVIPATIDDAASTISAGGTLRVAMTKVAAANTACQVTVWCLPRA